MLPVAAWTLEAMAAAMSEAGYTAIEGYLGHVCTWACLAGQEVSPQVARYLRHVKRGVARNSGPARRVEGLTEEHIERMRMHARSSEEETVLLACEVGTTFLLRVDELLKRKRRDARLDGRFGSLVIPVSKTDPEGRGVTRTIQCACSGRRQHGTRSSEPMSGLCRLSGASTCLSLDRTM